MPALDGALAFAQVNGVAVTVGDDLDLDMPGLGHVLLDVDGGVAEGRAGGVGGGGEGGNQVVLALHDLHADAAAAPAGLDDHRKPDAARDLGGFVRIVDRF